MYSITVDGGVLTITSSWGLFSAKRLDEGSAMLLEELATLPPPSRVLDLGCGSGAIGLALAKRWPNSTVELVDKDFVAVETTQANIDGNAVPNATVRLSAGFRDVTAEPFDLIVSNLPAQAGNQALDELLLGAHDHLRPGGTLVVVTVQGLKRYVRRRLEALFGDYHKAREGLRHVVAEAIRQS